MRAVLDTNVLVAAALSRHGAPASVLEAWLQGALELIISPMLLDEFERVLAYPKIRQHIAEPDARSLVRLTSEHSMLIDDPDERPSILSRDAEDDFLIALAFESRALLVSGDPDLLELADRIPVLAPSVFLAQLTET